MQQQCLLQQALAASGTLGAAKARCEQGRRLGAPASAALLCHGHTDPIRMMKALRALIEQKVLHCVVPLRTLGKVLEHANIKSAYDC